MVPPATHARVGRRRQRRRGRRYRDPPPRRPRCGSPVTHPESVGADADAVLVVVLKGHHVFEHHGCAVARILIPDRIPKMLPDAQLQERPSRNRHGLAESDLNRDDLSRRVSARVRGRRGNDQALDARGPGRRRRGRSRCGIATIAGCDQEGREPADQAERAASGQPASHDGSTSHPHLGIVTSSGKRSGFIAVLPPMTSSSPAA